ncbi:MAG: alpha/beta hydrolase [Ekhidna sp.]
MENLPEIIRAYQYWIVRLEKSEIHQWTQDHKQIDFNWNFIPKSFSHSKDDLQIGISKAYPKLPLEKVKYSAKALHMLTKIEEGDIILGISSDNKVQTIGRVTSNSMNSEGKANNISKIVLKPIASELKLESKVDLIQSQEVLSTLTQTKIRKAQLPISIRTKQIERPSGSGEKFHMKFEPAFYPDMYGDGEYGWNKKSATSKHVEKSSEVGEYDGIGEVSLFYATTRAQGKSTKKVKYGNKFGDLEYGQCKVTIPTNHKQGEIERPMNILSFSLRENPNKHIVVDKVEPVDKNSFIKQLDKDLSSLEKKSVLIFVHGYNNSFEEAARRTAQIAWDIPFKGLTGFFSWPSASKAAGYFKDIESADASIPSFEYFISELMTNTNAEQVHIIAHSMGNRIMTVGLNNLNSNAKMRKEIAKKIRQIVLAAPDIDQLVFKNTILPKFKNIGKRRTLYASENDKALWLSEQIRNQPRLGDAGKDLFVDGDLDTVDTTEVKSNIAHHAYAFDTKELLTDLYYLLNQELDPLNRRLRSQLRNSLPYWLFPK